MQGADGDLALFGLDRDGEALYRVVLRHAGEPVAVLSDRTGLPESALVTRLQPLLDLRLVRLHDDTVYAEPPHLAVGRLVSEQAHRLQQEQERLAAVRAAIPDLTAEHDRPRGEQGQPVSIEVLEPGDLVPTMESLLHNSTGELLFLRPDQFAVSSGQRMDDLVITALREGRRSRSLYPSSIVTDVPERIRARIDAGERVRVVPVVPARIAVFGDQAVVITEHWGSPVGHRLVVRQPGLIGAMVALFDAYWARGVTLPGLSDPGGGRQAEDLLALLARGAKDEQVARVLGVSLRTVRRRIAALMADLGAESRFQAGIEAVRRGLL
jgi:DNA-binding CsgD family transcriptional regulator